MQDSPVLSLSPSFNTYSNSNLADIAARVVEEFRAENETDSEFLDVADLFYGLETDAGAGGEAKASQDDLEQEDFEFTFVPRDAELSLISADQIFSNGQFRPVFNRSLYTEQEQKVVSATLPQTPLRKLLSEDPSSSCSSSEADELDGIPEGTYCVWQPKAGKEEASPPGKCKKSNSTGWSSKRWRLRDLVHRSNSDGKETFVFLTPSFRKGEDNNKVDKPKTAGKPKRASGAPTHYRKAKGDSKRRSYLPYRQDIVGFFANVNGSRN